MTLSEEVQTFGMAPSSPLEKKKQEVEELKAMEQMTFDFDEEEDTEEKKTIFSVYGLKNDGKTAICYGIPEPGEKVLVFSFDHKSSRPKDLPFIKPAELNIKVYDALKYIDKSTADIYQATSEVTYKYILSIMEQSVEKFNPAWIVFDGTEVLSSLMEQVMRLRNNLRPYQGISNLSVWKERKQYIENIHDRAVQTASKGVIYTMYTEKDTVIDRDGQTIRMKDIPKWIGSVMRETDVVIRADATFENDKRIYWAYVEGSKIQDLYPDGKFNVTGKRFRDVVVPCV